MKAVAGHGASVRPAIEYLARDGRSLAEDYLLCAETDARGRPVWRQMDDARRALGCDTPARGDRTARTWEHLIVSPDPADGCDLPTLRELAVCFAGRYLGGFQVAIFYHDDNPLRIPHAHLVVNSADLAHPGRRLSSWLTRARFREMREGLQGIARGLGLTALAPSGERSRGSVQPTYRTGRDVEIEGRGASWKRDVRDRMACAIRVSSDEREYVGACRALGLSVRESSSSRMRGEWVYSHPASGGLEVAGPTLGSDWSREGLGRRLAADAARGVRKPRGRSRERLLEAISSLEAADGSMALCVLGTTGSGVPVTASGVADMVDALAAHDVRSLADLGDALRECASPAERGRLLAARDLATSLGHLPQVRDAVDGPRVPQTAWAIGEDPVGLGYGGARGRDRQVGTAGVPARGLGRERGREVGGE